MVILFLEKAAGREESADGRDEQEIRRDDQDNLLDCQHEIFELVVLILSHFPDAFMCINRSVLMDATTKKLSTFERGANKLQETCDYLPNTFAEISRDSYNVIQSSTATYINRHTCIYNL